MKKILILLVVLAAFAGARSITAYSYCKATECSNQEEKCAIDRTGCMVPFKEYLDCIKADTVCTALTESDPFGECWTKCRKDSSNSLYKDLVTCYENCGAAENAALLSTAFTLLIVSFLVMIHI